LELNGEIEAERAQLNRLTSKKSQYKPQGKFNPSGGSGYRNNGQQGKSSPNSNFKDVICRVCKKGTLLYSHC
jgi:hypothetical protein